MSHTFICGFLERNFVAAGNFCSRTDTGRGQQNAKKLWKAWQYLVLKILDKFAMFQTEKHISWRSLERHADLKTMCMESPMLTTDRLPRNTSEAHFEIG